MSFLDDMFGKKERVIVKITYDDASLSTWVDAVELNRLPTSQRDQVTSFLSGIIKQLGGK